ncbi:hypothetical protein CDL15_Pgr027085 [Punica granatum]|uniref:PRP1 splicing factor N-terminal domain-containing protein n=1 Tax=Punica granatum TaxID=22663 RepID=A0A218XHW3_PUNGR|nr:hypothetical protein CDL15_Pgr027085 [Punica granatum]
MMTHFSWREAMESPILTRMMREMTRVMTRIENSMNLKGMTWVFLLNDEGDKEVDAVWEAIDKRMDSRRKDRREARLEQEIEKYHATNQEMRTRMSDVSIEPITAVEYLESEFFPFIHSEAWADIGF